MLDVSELTYRYPHVARAALAGVSLQVQRGQILGLLGQNGAGKSTLVAHLAGLLKVQRGEIRIDGAPLNHYRQRDPTRIAIAPQDYAFYPMLSVRENLACFAAVNRLPVRTAHEAIVHALDVTQLHDYAKVRAERLSGGLKRRLNLAIALLARPDLLVLDEPTVGVDAQSRSFLLDTIKRLAHEGAAVIYTTHYLEEVEAIADQVAILHHGEIRRYGALDCLLSEGAAHLTVRFTEAPPPTLLESVQALGDAQLSGKQLRLQLVPGIAPLDALNVIARCGVPMLEIHAGRYTLEQLFMQLTGEPLESAA